MTSDSLVPPMRALLALMALIASLVVALPSAASAQTTDPEPTARLVDVSDPGPRTAIVSSLRRALRAADLGRRVPSDLRPAPGDLLLSKRELPPQCTADGGSERRHQRCVRGDRESTVRVALLGNSHMQMWIHGLDREAQRLGIRLEPFIKYGCSPYLFRMYRDGARWPACESWRDWAIEKIKADPPDMVVVAGHTWLQLLDDRGVPVSRGTAWDRRWTDGVRRTAASLGRRVERVVVLGDATTRAVQPARCVARRGATMRSCEQPLTRHTRHLLRITRGAAREAGQSYLDMNRFLCLDDRCPVVAARYFVLRDVRGHIPATYSLRSGRAFAKSLGLRG